MIAAKGLKAPEAYAPLAESELKELVKYEPPPFDESSVALPPKPQLEEMPADPKWAELPAREESLKMPERPKTAVQPRLGMLPSAPRVEQPPAGDDIASIINALTCASKELEVEKLKNEAAELQNMRAQLVNRSRDELGALFCKKYNVSTLHPVYALTRGAFAKYGAAGGASVALLPDGQLSYQSESILNMRVFGQYTTMTPEQNQTIRRGLMASFECEAWRAGIADQPDFAAFLEKATTALMGADGEHGTERLSYDAVHSVLGDFKALVAAAKVGEAIADEPIRTFPPINGGKTGAVGSMGSMGLSYALFGSQLLNPLVENVFSGLGVSVEGLALSGDKNGLKLHVASFDATANGGAVTAHVNLGGILDRCGTVLARLLRDAMGVNVGSMKAVTDPENGTIKLSLGDLSYFAASSSWALSFAQNLGLTSFSGLDVTLRPTLNTRTGMLEVAVTEFNLAGGAGGLITKGVNSFMPELLGMAASYLPDMMYVKNPGRGDELGVMAIAVPNLMPEQLSFLGTQKFEVLAVTKQGLAVGVGMDTQPIRLKKAAPPGRRTPKTMRRGRRMPPR